MDGTSGNLSFATPEGWETRRKLLRVTDGKAGVVLERGQSSEWTVFLHDFFSKVRAGETILDGTLTFSRDIRGPLVVKVQEARTGAVQTGAAGQQSTEPRTIRLKARIALRVREDTVERLRARIEDIGSRIASNESKWGEAGAEARATLYRSIVGLSHTAVSGILFQSLHDKAAIRIHSKARRRLYQVHKNLRSWEPIVDYLCRHGGRDDAQFFVSWEFDRVQLTLGEREKLALSGDAWIRLYCLKYLGCGDLGEKRAGILDYIRQRSKVDRALALELEKIAEN